MSRKDRFIEKLDRFMRFAKSLATLSTCERLAVGAVVFPFDFSAIYAIGYNGPAHGLANDSCTGVEGRCECAHAEANAITKLDPSRVGPCIMFCTVGPCSACANAIINSGVIKVFIYDRPYREPGPARRLCQAGILVVNAENAENQYDRILERRSPSSSYR